MSLEGKTTFKTDIATGTDGDRQGNLGHATIHNNIGSVLNNLQDDVGIDSSADTASLKYKTAQSDTHIATTSGSHGISGSFVGDSDSQTLTNKTINSVNNTVTITESDISDLDHDALKIKSKSVETPSVDGQYPRYNTSTDDITWETPSGAGDMTQAEYDPAGIGEQLVGLTATQTLTNKTLTSPKVNEDVAVTSTATELNVLDGIPATLTATELGYVDGVTSAIQTQINLKAPLTSPTLVTPVLGVATATTINKVTITAPATASTLTIAQGSSLITAGAYATTLTSTATTGVTLPTTGTLSAIAGTETLTNKRVTKRITTISSHATPTVNTDNCDAVTITALATAITSMTTNLSGTPTNFQTLLYRILDNGTARAITWGASFEARGVDLPTTTTASKLLTVGFIYDTVDSIWGCVAVSEES